MLVVQENPYLIRKPLPDAIVDALRPVEAYKGVEERPEGRALAAGIAATDILRIGGVEENP
jgi:hypothetical protein